MRRKKQTKHNKNQTEWPIRWCNRNLLPRSNAIASRMVHGAKYIHAQVHANHKTSRVTTTTTANVEKQTRKHLLLRVRCISTGRSRWEREGERGGGRGGGERQTDRNRQRDTHRDRETEKDIDRQTEETERGVCYSDSLHRIHDPLESRDVLKRATPLTPGCSARCWHIPTVWNCPPTTLCAGFQAQASLFQYSGSHRYCWGYCMHWRNSRLLAAKKDFSCSFRNISGLPILGLHRPDHCPMSPSRTFSFLFDGSRQEHYIIFSFRIGCCWKSLCGHETCTVFSSGQSFMFGHIFSSTASHSIAK